MKKYLTFLGAFCLFGCVNSTQNLDVKTVENDLKVLNKEYKISQIIDKNSGEIYEGNDDWAIIFSENNFGAYVGCNRIFGQFVQEKGVIKFINPASTKMLCSKMKAEDLFNANLTSQTIIENGLENENIKIIFK